MDVVIRPARREETGLLAEVERDGDRRYAGYDGIPDGFDDVASASSLESACQEGRLWVAVSTADGGTGAGSVDGPIIGFVMAEMADGLAHLAQVSVALAFQGEGVGRRLIETVCQWARAKSLPGVTLCTFDDVAWNRPLYGHLGFVVLPEDRWTPELRDLFEADGPLGLDLRRRVVMKRDLTD